MRARTASYPKLDGSGWSVGYFAETFLTGSPDGERVCATGAERGTFARYDNCTELNRDFKHGVSDRKKPRRWWVNRGATRKGAYKPKLHRSVKSTMDRENNHIACEK